MQYRNSRWCGSRGRRHCWLLGQCCRRRWMTSRREPCCLVSWPQSRRCAAQRFTIVGQRLLHLDWHSHAAYLYGRLVRWVDYARDCSSRMGRQVVIKGPASMTQPMCCSLAPGRMLRALPRPCDRQGRAGAARRHLRGGPPPKLHSQPVRTGSGGPGDYLCSHPISLPSCRC